MDADVVLGACSKPAPCSESRRPHPHSGAATAGKAQAGGIRAVTIPAIDYKCSFATCRGKTSMDAKITVAALQQMKRDGKKSVGVVAWDYQIARIADRAGFDFISVGDSVGVNLWGRADVLDVTLDEMLICCKAVRRGTERALVSCDMPYGPVQQGSDAALAAAFRLIKDGGADMIKVDAAADFPDVVRTLVREGIAVFAQFGLTPQTAA